MNPFDQLLTQNSGSAVAPEVLEMLGRKASQLFQSQGLPLNQAIAQVVADHPELGNEHVKRIVEFANTVTFQEMFQNSEDKNVHFDVADPGVVLRDLKDGGTPSHSGKTLSSDYQKPPLPVGSGPDLDASLMQQFTGSGQSMSEATKVASVHSILRGAKKNGKFLAGVAAGGAAAYTGARAAKRLIDGPEKTASVDSVDHEKHANPIEDIYDAMIRMQSTKDKLAESYETMDLKLKDAQEDFYRNVKQQIDNGDGLGGVVGVLEKLASEDLVEAVMIPVTHRLMRDGYDRTHLLESLHKTAGVVPNLNHPLLASFDAITKLANEMAVCDRAIEDTDTMLSELKIPFKKLAGALTTEVKDAIGPHGKIPAGIRQRFPRA